MSKSGKMMPHAIIDKLSTEMKFNHFPEVTFANNIFQMTNAKKNCVYYINAIDAIKYTNYEYLHKHFEDFSQNEVTTNNRSVNYLPKSLK